MQASPFAIQVKDFGEPVQRALRLDPWLLLAAVGLLTCGVFVLHGATSDDIPGQPYHYVYRQIAYGVVGLVLMLLLSRFDYSRTREWKAGLYVFTIGSIFAVFALGGVTRGPKRGVKLPFFNFPPPEVATVVVVLVAAPAAGVHVLKPYQVDRLTAFPHPTDNPRKEGYQLTQSITAIGAGQKTGRGNQATQTKLNFLPEHHTDFVFSVVGEEYGFVGAAVVLSLFALLIWRSLRILTMAKNLYGMLIAAGITAMLMFQVFVNVGMTIGIMPITGVPLPLISYGGSSVIVTLVALGLLQSVHAQARELAAAKGRDRLL